MFERNFSGHKDIWVTAPTWLRAWFSPMWFASIFRCICKTLPQLKYRDEFVSKRCVSVAWCSQFAIPGRKSFSKKRRKRCRWRKSVAGCRMSWTGRSLFSTGKKSRILSLHIHCAVATFTGGDSPAVWLTRVKNWFLIASVVTGIFAFSFVCKTNADYRFLSVKIGFNKSWF